MDTATPYRGNYGDSYLVTGRSPQVHAQNITLTAHTLASGNFVTMGNCLEGGWIYVSIEYLLLPGQP